MRESGDSVENDLVQCARFGDGLLRSRRILGGLRRSKRTNVARVHHPWMMKELCLLTDLSIAQTQMQSCTSGTLSIPPGQPRDHPGGV